jgi:hypothetical protein
MKPLAVLALIVLSAPTLQAQTMPDTPLSGQVEITIEHDSEGERAAAAQLRELLDRYDIARWTFTDRVLIDETQIPHSHPVLTLHTRSVGRPEDQLATYVHEQFHWWVASRDAAEEAAVADFRQLFPDAPAGGSEGGRDQYSTYLHLMVCDLEFQAMTILVGEERARQIMRSYRHYTWIYDRVLNDPRIREINLRHGFDVGRADATAAPEAS